MESEWHRDFMTRMVEHQFLLASSTTEGGGGGNVRSSEAPVEHIEGRIHLVRDASVISYGAQADGVVTTARRNADAAASDQVLVVLEKKNYSLERTGGNKGQAARLLHLKRTTLVGKLKRLEKQA